MHIHIDVYLKRCSGETEAEGELLMKQDLEEGSIVIDSDCSSNDEEQESDGKSVSFGFNNVHKTKVCAKEVIQNWRAKTRRSG